MRVSALRRPGLFEPIQKSVVKDKFLQPEIGIPLDRVEQIICVEMGDSENSDAVIYHVAREEDAVTIVHALLPDAEERTYAGRSYAWKKAGNDKSTCMFHDGAIVVTAKNEEHLRRMIVAGRQGAVQMKWAPVWNSAADSDAVAIVNVRRIRSEAGLAGPFNLLSLFFGVPAELAPLLEISSAVVTVKADDVLHVKFQLATSGSTDIKRLEGSAGRFVELSQAEISKLRVEASQRDDEQGAHELQLLDRIDELMDRLEIKSTDSGVEATVDVTQSEVIRLFECAKTLAK
jgi:hypothetical protein